MRKTSLLYTLLFFIGIQPVPGQTFTPGVSYFGANGYVEYLAGNLPIIMTAPHGGLLSPATLPDRDCAGCSTVNDFNTQELARAFAEAVHTRTGCWPHVVFNKLHRRKLDANRDLPEAADGNPAAATAWHEFHAFVESAKNQVFPAFGKGLYLDLHGHGHSIQRLELGYLLSQAELALSDDTINHPNLVRQSSIRYLAGQNAGDLSHAALLRGPLSLGSLLADRGYPATPSASDPFPDPDEDYFNGGYNTARHSSYPGGATIDGLQIECNRQGIRDSMHNVLRFADSLAVSVLDYLGLHYFGEALAELCLPEAPVQMQLAEVYPNPYCINFFVKKTAAAPAGIWMVEMFDFYGNLLKVKELEDENPVEFVPRYPQHVLLVVRRDGVVTTTQSLFRFCR
ncbi:MAG: hypothetical protein SFV22_16975 [Saprospiraceae bacterium]|nr:hypothetical protein [Saprospiraceae bacterium]